MASTQPKESSTFTMLGKVALVTGAGSGIGAATAIKLSSLGASVSICDKNAEMLKITADKCASVGQTIPLTITADLTNESDVKDVVDSTINHFSKLDVLINNAGVIDLGTIETTSLEQFDRLFNINVRAVYHLTMLAVPYLIESKGNIVNVSSIAAIGTFGKPNILAYGMTKSAIDRFTKNLAFELGPKQVRVNSVNPGAIETNIFKNNGFGEELLEKFLQEAKDKYPLRRSGRPEEVADAITFLISDKASFITGVNLLVDGGERTYGKKLAIYSNELCMINCTNFTPQFGYDWNALKIILEDLHQIMQDLNKVAALMIVAIVLQCRYLFTIHLYRLILHQFPSLRFFWTILSFQPVFFLSQQFELLQAQVLATRNLFNELDISLLDQRSKVEIMMTTLTYIILLKQMIGKQMES